LEQISFVVGNRGAVVESNFYTKLQKLDVQEGMIFDFNGFYYWKQ
jgi:hypothetical protein